MLLVWVGGCLSLVALFTRDLDLREEWCALRCRWRGSTRVCTISIVPFAGRRRPHILGTSITLGYAVSSEQSYEH